MPNKLVPTPFANVEISRKAPLALPPCSKNLNLFCQTSIVTPLPESVVLVTALPNKISPPSSPPTAFTVILSPVTIRLPVISVFEFIDTFVPLSVILLSPRCSALTDLSNLLFVGNASFPMLS